MKVFSFYFTPLPNKVGAVSKLSENKTAAGDKERNEEMKKGGRGEEGNEMRDIRDWPRGDGEKSKAGRRKRQRTVNGEGETGMYIE